MGNLRIEPSLDGQESSVGYYNRSDLRDIAAGDMWVGGINCWRISGCTVRTPVLNSFLNITNNGNITIPYTLRTPVINVYTMQALITTYITLDDDVIITGYLNSSRSWDSGSVSTNFVDTTSNYIYWRNVGTAAPSFTTRSIGTKLALYPHLTTSSTEFAAGVESNKLWYSVGCTATGHRWYCGTSKDMYVLVSGVVVYGKIYNYQTAHTASTKAGTTILTIANITHGIFSNNTNSGSFITITYWNFNTCRNTRRFFK